MVRAHAAVLSRPLKPSPRTAQIQRSTLSPERRWERVEGLRVLRATDESGHSYTLKRFGIMEGGLRTMLVSELNGLLSCPEHVAVALCDAFLDGLEAVVVLNDGGGFYLRDVLEVRGALSEQNASVVVRQVLAGLRHLHEQAIVHNDVDARNVLISPQGQVPGPAPDFAWLGGELSAVSDRPRRPALVSTNCNGSC